jgi:hypothetical protein
LAIQGRNPGEALEYLERAARQYPRAHLVAARVLVDVGRIDEAAGEIRQYLSSASDTSNRQEVESWLTRLDQQLASAGSSE